MSPFSVAWKLALGVGALVDFFAHIWLYHLIYMQAALLNASWVGHELGVWRKIGEGRTVKGQKGLA